MAAVLLLIGRGKEEPELVEQLFLGETIRRFFFFLGGGPARQGLGDFVGREWI